MIKQLIIFLICFFTIPSFAMINACGQAEPTDSINFCSSFKSIAKCHCIESGLPQGMCNNMEALYQRMLSVFGSLQRVCEYQHHTSTQDCIDAWNCYRLGGSDSRGRMCNTNSRACT